MNEDQNSFSVDVQAETQSITAGFNSDAPLPSQIINVMEDSGLDANPASVQSYQPPIDSELPRSVPYTAPQVQAIPDTKPLQSLDSDQLISSKKYESVEVQKDLISEKIEYKESEDLIPSELLEASGFESKTNILPQTAQTYGLDFNVKIDPEQVYEKTQQLQSQMQTLQEGVNTMANELNNSWIPNSNKDDFEERPLIEATNLIFENRRNKFSEPPMWC